MAARTEAHCGALSLIVLRISEASPYACFTGVLYRAYTSLAIATVTFALGVSVCRAQDGAQPVRAAEHARPPDPPPISSIGEQPISSIGDHWKFFLDETFGPITPAGTIFNAAFSQVTNSDPRYGTNGAAFGQRIGASTADIVAQNFLGDFLVASAFHEDPRYFRRGESYGFWYRFGYAVSRAVIIRTDDGSNSFNWDNLLGCAMTAGFSNLYYPAPSRTGGAMLIHFATSMADTGFANLAPEFWPDFRRKVFHWHHHAQAVSE